MQTKIQVVNYYTLSYHNIPFIPYCGYYCNLLPIVCHSVRELYGFEGTTNFPEYTQTLRQQNDKAESILDPIYYKHMGTTNLESINNRKHKTHKYVHSTIQMCDCVDKLLQQCKQFIQNPKQGDILKYEPRDEMLMYDCCYVVSNDDYHVNNYEFDSDKYFKE